LSEFDLERLGVNVLLSRSPGNSKYQQENLDKSYILRFFWN